MLLSDLLIMYSVNKGLSTAEGRRGHVTAHTYSVTIKVQTLKVDILKIVSRIQSYTMYATIYGQRVRRPASGFMVCTKFRHGLNLMGTEIHALSRLRRLISPWCKSMPASLAHSTPFQPA